MKFVLPLLAVAPFAVADSSPSITGTYRSNWDIVHLEQRGNQVVGTYVCCGGGTIHGTITGRLIRYHWRQPGGDGQGAWIIEPPDRLSGTWGVGTSDRDGGRWDLVLASSQIAR